MHTFCATITYDATRMRRSGQSSLFLFLSLSLSPFHSFPHDLPRSLDFKKSTKKSIARPFKFFKREAVGRWGGDTDAERTRAR